MSESQNHGFIFEDITIKANTGLSSEKYRDYIEERDGKRPGYTDIDDIVPGTYPNGSQIEKPYSIKATGKNDIDMGDLKRHYEAVKNNKDKILIAGRFKQIQDIKKFYEIWEIDFKSKPLGACMSIPEEEMIKFINWIKPIHKTYIKKGKTKDERRALAKPYQDEYKVRRAKLEKKYGKPILSINVKIDKEQSRVQCGLKFKDIEKIFAHKIHRDNYKGIQLPFEINSPARKRNGKK